ncbi:hypothetical protein DRW07_02040 [Alteromonas sediminis]|uniref:Uncharacterized protein n=1 Tax=Alteromonas sediminis TaxID=2259342 RepID=A0A3N5YQ89_9ALTE|nr:hypothetical protein [Alteromonas sediminis]RPJ68211.1 hypothetical protein DRW07_02040 [Alteromonas sediminis]
MSKNTAVKALCMVIGLLHGVLITLAIVYSAAEVLLLSCLLNAKVTFGIRRYRACYAQKGDGRALLCFALLRFY